MVGRWRSRAAPNPAQSMRGRYSISPALLPAQNTQVYNTSRARRSCPSLLVILLADVCWFHGSTRLAASPRHWLYRRGTSHHLAIFDIDSSLAGDYSVCAFDNKEEVWSRFRVNVRGTRRAEHPPELVKLALLSCWHKFKTYICCQVIQPSSGAREWGAGATFLCQAAGYPEPRFGLVSENCINVSQGHLLQRRASPWGQ